MDEYMDFGSSDEESDVEESKFDDEEEEFQGNSYKQQEKTAASTTAQCYMDSDEEEQVENDALLKMMTTSMPHRKTQKEIQLEDFEAEMEAELDRRTLKIEIEGGVRHQMKLKLDKSKPLTSISPSTSKPGPSRSNVTPETQKKSIVKSFKSSEDASLKDVPKKSVSFADSKTSEVDKTTSLDEVPLEKQFYDDIYYDSDESVGETEEDKVGKREKRAVLSPDQLFYDPAADSKDEDWMNKRRVNSYGNSPPDQPCPTSSTKPNVPCSSDAVLNCPACFTVLCMDCQRHEFYTGQYRAMFVMNCSIQKDQTFNIPLKTNPKRKRKFEEDVVARDNPKVPLVGQPGDIFNPVHCKVCNTQVAMYDADEVYHFYNILSSHS